LPSYPSALLMLNLDRLLILAVTFGRYSAGGPVPYGGPQGEAISISFNVLSPMGSTNGKRGCYGDMQDPVCCLGVRATSLRFLTTQLDFNIFSTILSDERTF
jgi:hypothetical protein